MSWTDERVERMSALWLEGRSASQIAAELGGGVSRNAVIGKVHRLGLSGRAVPPAAEAAPPRVGDVPSPGSPKTPPREPVDTSRDLQALSSPAEAPPAPAAPAAQSVAPFVAPPAPRAAAEIGSMAAHAVDDVASVMAGALEPITVNFPALRPAGAAIAVDSAKDVVIPISGRVTILELSGSMCRWPIGDPTSLEFRFCGCRAVGTLPYCQDHARVAFQPVADRRRAERLIRIA